MKNVLILKERKFQGSRRLMALLYIFCSTVCVSHSVVFDSVIPMDCSPPDSYVHGILQARILEWVVMPSSRNLPDPGIKPGSPTLQADSLLSEPPGRRSLFVDGRY